MPAGFIGFVLLCFAFVGFWMQYWNERTVQTMRDRLIELLLNAPQIPCVKGGQATGKRYQTFQNIADHLLANGVIVPPCKAGDPVWFVEEGGDIGFSLIEKIRIEQRAKWNPELVFNCIYLVDFLRPIPFSAIGRAVFLTKEEAEKALKEREQGGR